MQWSHKYTTDPISLEVCSGDPSTGTPAGLQLRKDM